MKKNIRPTPATGLSLTLEWSGYTELPSTWQPSGIDDDAARLYWPVAGRSDINNHQIQPGRLYLLPALTRLTCNASTTIKLYWAHLRLELPGRVNLFSCWQPGILEIVPEAAEELTARFQQLTTEQQHADATAFCFRQEFLYGLLRRFFTIAAPDFAAAQNYRLHLLQPLLDQIAAHPEERWELEELAARLTVSKVSCNHLFQELLGMPPGRWITLRRIAKARKLLLLTKEAMPTIAERCGFCDSFHFSRVFKQTVGISPRTFRVHPEIWEHRP